MLINTIFLIYYEIAYVIIIKHLIEQKNNLLIQINNKKMIIYINIP